MKRSIKIALIVLVTLTVCIIFYYKSNQSITISELTKVDLVEKNHYGLTMYIVGGGEEQYRKDLNEEYLPLVIEYLNSLKIKEIPLESIKIKSSKNSNITERQYIPYTIIIYKREKYGRLIITTQVANHISVDYNGKISGLYQVMNEDINYGFLDNIFEKLQVYVAPKR